MSTTIKDIDIYLNNKDIRHYYSAKNGQRIDVPISLSNGNDACICIVGGSELAYRIDERVILSSTPTPITSPAITMLIALLNNEPCYFA